MAKSSSVDVEYSCSFAAQPAYYSDLVNVATATWDAASYHTPNGSASGEATFQFTLPEVVINKIVTVTDSYAGTLGTVTGTDAEPWALEEFNYSRTVSVPSTNCVEYPNTATIVEIGLSASRLVRVCGPLQTGALTMGFWQNKNGQALIKNAGVVEGTTICKLTPFLRQYAPFQDLSASANCTAVATYVTNVIKAANASGSSMNAMLKAQMLATSLDVYFKGIGGVLVDLTYIKAGGGYQDVSAAFGGATSLTISQMLAYAASQSNAGGSMWYGNVKSMQELAKNAFDAINNQWIFAP